MYPTSQAGVTPAELPKIIPPYEKRGHYAIKFAESILVTPFVKTARWTFNTLKLITYDVTKAGILKILGHHNQSYRYIVGNYLNVARITRDMIFIPSIVKATFKDLISKPEEFKDDFDADRNQSYLKVNCKKAPEVYSSAFHGRVGREVIRPEGIEEFAAESDGSLMTVMASHFLKPDVLAINFGIPNVASFVTEEKEDGSVQTIKVDAKSLKREKMSFHATNGKIQSGVFLVPTNLPPEALNRYKEAAEKLQGQAHITCVNTNCRVLKEAGFSIEGKNLENVVFPSAMFEHFLYRNVFYTDSNGVKHKVHFDIVKTTDESLEKHFEKIDIAVVGTRIRHKQRNADTEEDRKARGVAARAIIANEKERLAVLQPQEQQESNLKRRKLSISKPSWIGNLAARFWGRHLLIEVDFSDKKERFAEAFKTLEKLKPFPHENPSTATKIKKNVLFAQPMINFIRRHMMGSSDDLLLNTQDLLTYLKSTDGAKINYAVLDGKVALSRVKANGDSEDALRQTADWAWSKHAVLAERKDVYVSGEIWYDNVKQKIMMNRDSGTYMPTDAHVIAGAALANEIFETTLFEVAPVTTAA